MKGKNKIDLLKQDIKKTIASKTRIGMRDKM